MATQPILRYPHPVLKKVCHRVEAIDNVIHALVRDLLDTMRDGPGSVGVAAPQIGVTLRVCVVDVSASRHGKDNNHGQLCMINPEITARKRDGRHARRVHERAGLYRGCGTGHGDHGPV